MTENWLNRRSRRDLVWLLVLACAAFVLAFVTDAVEVSLRRLADFLPLHGAILAFLLALMLGLLVFALRRWRDAARVEADYRSSFDQAPIGYFRMSAGGQLLRVNQAAASIFGFDSPEQMVQALADPAYRLYVDPQLPDRLRAELAQHGIVRDLECQAYRKDGSVIWLLQNVRTSGDPRGAAPGFEGAWQDITERQETGLAYRQLVEASFEGIIIIHENHIVFANAAAGELFGVPPARLTTLAPTRLIELIHPDDRAGTTDWMRDRLAQRNVPSRRVFQIQRSGGDTRWIEMEANRIAYRGETAVLAVLEDRTAQMQAHDAMERGLRRMREREALTAALARAGSDLEVVLNTLVRSIADFVGDLCGVVLTADGMQAYVLAAVAHGKPERDGVVRSTLLNQPVPLEQLDVTRVLHGEPLLIAQVDENHLATISMPEYLAYARRFGISSFLAVPLRQSSAILGMLFVSRDREGAPYTLEDQVMLQEFADRAALAVANAQLVRQLRQELEARQPALPVTDRPFVALEGISGAGGTLPRPRLADPEL